MGKISYITKMVDFYKNNGVNATVIDCRKKRTCIIDGHGTNNIKILVAFYMYF